MRCYLIDEIPSADIEKIDTFLREHATGSALERLYWVKIPAEFLNGIQVRHKGCHPFVFAIELGPDRIRMEFFIRSLKTLQCDCQSYCTPEQRAFIFDYSEKLLEDLGIGT